MSHALRNEHFVPRFRDDFFSADGELEPPVHHDHQLVCRMDEIIPFPAGWISKQITGVAAPTPVLHNLVAIERYGEFLACEIGQE
jgi:hypothetical protein